jgi:hypothetical protein
MKKIISVTRRSDIPAFYKDWFKNRLNAGFAGWENPFGGQKYLVSLKPQDVTAFVFWSKNYRSFLDVLPDLKQNGFNCLFQYTITGLPREFEVNLVETEDAIDSFKEISSLFSAEQVFWRYDPILTSAQTDKEYHLDRFEYIARQLSGYTRRCFVSYAVFYGKVERNFRAFTKEQGIKFYDPYNEQKIELANQLADIAAQYGMQVYTCCGDYLIGEKVKKAHCIDGDLISQLFYSGELKVKSRPTRKECGCSESTDIGKYDTCPHGCIYCYANVNKEKARQMHDNHDPGSPFLGYAKEDGDEFVAEIKKNRGEQVQNKSKSKMHQLKLPGL